MTLPSDEAMQANRAGGAAGSSPGSPEAMARSARLEADVTAGQPCRRLSTILCVSVALIGTALNAPAASAQTPQPTSLAPSAVHDRPVDAFIAEAAQRFRLPEAWIRAVMRAESAFDPTATSPKGAMGLMQLMPQTYAVLRARHGLGSDAYDPRDNILAGAAYLRELYDQFGPSGFLAAYNAGPGRYLDHLLTGRALPAETRSYVARIVPRLVGAAPALTSPAGLSVISLEPRPTLFAPGVGWKVTDGPQSPLTTDARQNPSLIVRAPDARLFPSWHASIQP